jgi:sugar phosphate isomerase/epimerase
MEIHLLQPSEIDRNEAKELMAYYDLDIVTIGNGMLARMEGLTFADPSPKIRQRVITRIKEQIALAAFLNSAVTIGSIMGRIGDDAMERSVRRFSAIVCLEECCRVAAEAGVTLLLEPLNRYEGDYVNTVEDGLSIIQQIGSPNLKLLADTFHMNIEEPNIETSLKKAGRHLGLVHLSDSNRQAPGYGHLNFHDVIKTLQGILYDGYLSFEVLPVPDSQKAAEHAIRYVKGIETNC